MLALVLAALLPASAQDCDARALDKALADAAPARVAKAYTTLAACDPARAKKAAAKQLPRMVADGDQIPAAIAAIEVGAAASLSSWLDTQLPDDRSRTIAGIGAACPDHPEAVSAYFVDAKARLGATFWDERWYRGLAACRTEGIRSLLTEALDSPDVGRMSRDRSTFFGLLEVYARNLQGEAIPTLTSYLASAQDDEEATLLMNVFGDAAGLGRPSGPDAEVVQTATDAIVNAAPTLPQRALTRARDVLNAMGQEPASDGLAAHMWSDRRIDGAYTYGASLVELATCKNGKTRAMLHLGSFTEMGLKWPDQLAEAADAKIASAWPERVAPTCKGTGEVTVTLTETPVAGEAGLAAWFDAQREAFATASEGAKTKEVVHGVAPW